MSRTYRRRGQRHEYRRVLLEWKWRNLVLVPVHIDARSKEGRRAIARFHSDAYWTLRSTAPHWYRRIFYRGVSGNFGRIRPRLEFAVLHYEGPVSASGRRDYRVPEPIIPA